MANMLTDPSSAMPGRVIAGDSLKVDRADLARDYSSADGYSLSYSFVPMAGGTPATIAATGGIDTWSLAVPAATTEDWAPGEWRWAAKVANGADRLTVDCGTLRVEPDPTDVDVDSRSHARRVLDAIELAIEGRASKTTLETTLADGRQIKHMNHADLLVMRKAYAGMVAAEDRRAGRGGPRRILMSL